MTTLVTGATGLVGNNVVRLLVDRGEKVRVLIRQESLPAALEGLQVEVVRGDVCDPASLEPAFQGVDRVIHAAAHVHIGWRRGELQREVNVEGTRNVAAAALTAGARMVHVSSIDALGIGSLETPVDENTLVNGELACPYVITKREGERVVLDYVARGLNAVIVNPGFMLGPWDWKPSSGRVLLKMATGWGIIAPPGTNSYCDVRDVAAGIVAALERGRTGQRYILAGKTLSHMEAMRIFAGVTGVKPPNRVAIRPTIKAIGAVGDLVAWVTGHETEVNSAATGMSLLPKNYSSARAEAELGYHTRDVAESAADAWAWFKQHGYVKA